MLISHTLRYLPAQLLSPLAQLASMVLWTHWLAPAEMGVYTLVTVTQEIAYLLCMGWFSTYALRYLPPPGDADARQRYLGAETRVVLAGIAASVVVAAVTAATLPGLQDRGAAVAAIACFFATKAVGAHYAERVRAQASFVTYTLLQTVGPLGGLLLGWLALQHIAPTAVVLLSAYAVAQGAAVLLALPALGLSRRLPPFDRALLKRAWAFGGPVLMLAALGWVAENYIRYLVQWHSGAAALGLMIVGWSLGRRCAAVAATLVTTASFPLAARLLNEGRRAEALAHLSRSAALLLAVLVPVTVAVEMLAPVLVELVVAAEYREMTTELLSLSMLAGAVRNLHMHTTDQLMVLERRIAMLAKIDLFEIAACAALSLAGLVGWGLQGAVVGQALGSLATLALSMALAQRVLGLHWPWRDTLRIAVASAAMALALWLVEASHDLGGLVLSSLVGALAYAACCAVAYRRELRTAWRARAARRAIV